MRAGMQTVEYVPKTLQEEWTEAWNTVHRIRKIAKTELKIERALKWIL